MITSSDPNLALLRKFGNDQPLNRFKIHFADTDDDENNYDLLELFLGYFEIKKLFVQREDG